MNINYTKLNSFIKRFSDECPFTFKSEWDLIFNPHIKIVSVIYNIKFTIIKLNNKVINIYNNYNLIFNQFKEISFQGVKNLLTGAPGWSEANFIPFISCKQIIKIVLNNKIKNINNNCYKFINITTCNYITDPNSNVILDVIDNITIFPNINKL